jgi:uncharacterized protein YdaU (DUF1376 family)
MSEKRSDTWMPFYVGDYLSATTRLTTEQHGAYFLLLLDYWKNGPPPNDDAVLAQIVRMSPAAWRKAKPALIGFFDQADGHLIQRRVEKERDRASNVTEERSKAGKAGAAKRWGKGGQRDSKPIANAIDLPMANGQQNDAPSQSHIGSSEPIIGSSNEDSSSGDDAPLSVDEVVEAWNDRMVRLGLPAVRRLTPTRKRQLQARIRENSINDWKLAMDAIERSPFCRGDNDRGWRADFDFLLQPKSFTKLIEGAYDH